MKQIIRYFATNLITRPISDHIMRVLDPKFGSRWINRSMDSCALRAQEEPMLVSLDTWKRSTHGAAPMWLTRLSQESLISLRQVLWVSQKTLILVSLKVWSASTDLRTTSNRLRLMEPSEDTTMRSLRWSTTSRKMTASRLGQVLLSTSLEQSSWRENSEEVILSPHLFVIMETDINPWFSTISTSKSMPSIHNSIKKTKQTSHLFTKVRMREILAPISRIETEERNVYMYIFLTLMF